MGFLAKQGGDEIPEADKINARNFKNQRTEQAFEVKEKSRLIQVELAKQK